LRRKRFAKYQNAGGPPRTNSERNEERDAESSYLSQKKTKGKERGESGGIMALLSFVTLRRVGR